MTISVIEAITIDEILKGKSAQIASLSAEIERLRAELAFYADPENWKSPSRGFAAQYDPEPSPVYRVKHHRAAAALQPKEGK